MPVLQPVATATFQLIDSASTFGRDAKCVSTLSWRIERLPWRLTCIGNVPRDRDSRRTNGGTVDRLLIVGFGLPIISAMELLGAVLAAVVGEGCK